MDSKADLKKRNRKKILSVVRKGEEISKRDLQKLTGLSWSTVSLLTSELIEEGFFSISGKQNLGVGRCPEMLTMNSQRHLFIGVDVNMADIRIITADMSAKILSKKVFENVTTYDDAMTKINATIDSMMTFYGKENIVAISFAAQGYVDIQNGVSSCIYDIDNWRNVPLRQIFEEKYHLPVTVVHDTFAVMAAESEFGSTAKLSANVMLLYYAKKVGISAAFCIDGSIYLGHSGISGEIGQMLVPSFKDAAPIVLEQHVTESNILREFLADHPDSGVKSYAELAELAKAGEQEAAMAFQRLGKRIGTAVASCVNILDPETLLLSGIDGEESDLYRDALFQMLEEHCQNIEKIKVIVSKRNEDFVALGAAITAIQRYCEEL